ncbi:MAG: hypothetical protein RL033_4757, partial [Pseudomonadota bacterium]
MRPTRVSRRTVYLWRGIVGSWVALGCGGAQGPSSPAAPAVGSTDSTTVIEQPVLPGPWLASFQTGLDADEQLWLLPEDGAPVSVTQVNDDPSRTISRGTYGYLDVTGYISETLFDAINARVIVSHVEESSRPVRWLDLKSGRWTTLDLTGSSSLRDTERGALILSTDGDTLTVTAAVGTQFETVARLALPADTFATDMKALRYSFAGTERVLLGRLGQFERSDSGWQQLPSPIPASGEPNWITPSPDGAQLCVVGEDGSAWLVDGSAAIALDLSFTSDRCSFSPNGSLAAFTGVPGRYNLHLADLHGASVADFDYLYLQQNRAGFAYGTNGPQLVRLNWQSLELETLPSPTWCPADREGGLDTGLF